MNRVRRAMVNIGGQPSCQIFDVDPPLAPGEVEIDTSDLTPARACGPSIPDLLAIQALTRGEP